MICFRLGRAFSIALLLVACGTSEKQDGNNGTTGGTPGQAGADSVAKGGAGGASGMGATGGSGDTGQGGDNGTLTGCELERAELERSMAQKLDAAAVDASVTGEPNFTLALSTASGHRFVHSHGDSSITTSYESASTSKWVAALVILDLVDQGVLALSDEPSAYLPFWQTSGVTLAQLLSFTSGFSKEALCFNLPNADFADCVQRAYEANVDVAPPPGSEFYYSSTHLQIAGLMAVRAASASGFAELFAAWQAKTGLFPSGAFDLPSATNPRLAGGMHWTAAEYLEFLRALYDGKLLTDETRAAMLTSQRGEAKVGSSPALDALNQDWAYGFGNWLECPTAQGPDSYDCGAAHRNSSPGAYGAYPFIDWAQRYFGILARQGKLGTFREGDSLYQTVAEDAVRWASLCSP
jgi:CubicO group peptidase (beta-lactamase class C family)